LIKRGFFVIKGNYQKIVRPVFMFFNAVIFFKDRTYPGAGASGRTAGNVQLHHFFRSECDGTE